MMYSPEMRRLMAGLAEQRRRPGAGEVALAAVNAYRGHEPATAEYRPRRARDDVDRYAVPWATRLAIIAAVEARQETAESV